MSENNSLKVSLRSWHNQRTLPLHYTPTGKKHVNIELAPIRSQAGETTCFAETMFENELFSYENEPLSVPISANRELVGSANDGTLFLDEVGDILLNLQVKLLHLLETGTCRRTGGIGGTEPLRASFRLISATHRPLKDIVDKEQFRKDLIILSVHFQFVCPACPNAGKTSRCWRSHCCNVCRPTRNYPCIETASRC